MLILNRLSLRPTAISKIGGWADTQAVAEVDGIAGVDLNDDRIGRALDEIHAHLAAVRQHLKLDRPLVVGDSKLISRPNMLGFCRVGARFIGPASLTAADREVPLSLWAAGKPMARLDLPVADQPPAAGR